MIRFLVDTQLGKLCKWLRVAGFDAEYLRDDPDDSFENAAPEAVFLTRCRRHEEEALGRGIRTLLVRSDHWREQMAEVFLEFGISREQIRPFSRCVECNLPLLPAAKPEIASEVPSYVYRTHEEFKKCPGCSRILWRGSHTRRMIEELSFVFEVQMRCCDYCGTRIGTEGYDLFVSSTSHAGELRLTEEDLAEAGSAEELVSIMRELEGRDEEELVHDVRYEFRGRLCLKCHRRLVEFLRKLSAAGPDSSSAGGKVEVSHDEHDGGARD